MPIRNETSTQTGRRRRRWIVIAFLVMLVSIPCYLTFRDVQHKRLDYELVASIKRRAYPAALAALRAGANPNARDNSGYSLRLTDLWKMLSGKSPHSNANSGPDALSLAVTQPESAGDGALVKALLAKGADPNSVVYGLPVLAQAVRANNFFATQALLERGLSPNTLIGPDLSILEDAVFHSSTDLVKLLLAKGADAKFQGIYEGTALHLAARSGKIDVFVALLEHGADINAYDHMGWTPLMHAAYRGQPEIAAEALRRGADFHVRDRQGRDALDLASEVPYLAGLPANVVNDFKRKRAAVATLLKKAGAK